MLKDVKSKRITAMIAMAAVLFVMLFSAIYISKHADHKCEGERCPVCAVMEQCENNIKNIEAIASLVAVAFCLGLSVYKSEKYVIVTYSDYSLISQKVRMNN